MTHVIYDWCNKGFIIPAFLPFQGRWKMNQFNLCHVYVSLETTEHQTHITFYKTEECIIIPAIRMSTGCNIYYIIWKYKDFGEKLFIVSWLLYYTLTKKLSLFFRNVGKAELKGACSYIFFGLLYCMDWLSVRCFEGTEFKIIIMTSIYN